jgi:hypothetical protein
VTARQISNFYQQFVGQASAASKRLTFFTDRYPLTDFIVMILILRKEKAWNFTFTGLI